MSNVKHTPGGWGRNIPPATKYPVIYAGRNTHVAIVKTDLPPEEVEANANLIAAAPDLLAALKLAAVEVEAQLEAFTDSYTIGGNLETMDRDERAEWGRLAQLSAQCIGAINRAEGKS